MRVKCVDLYLGDSLKIMSEFKDNSIDLIITDPPYLLGAGGGGGIYGKEITIMLRN